MEEDWKPVAGSATGSSSTVIKALKWLPGLSSFFLVHVFS